MHAELYVFTYVGPCKLVSKLDFKKTVTCYRKCLEETVHTFEWKRERRQLKLACRAEPHESSPPLSRLMQRERTTCSGFDPPLPVQSGSRFIIYFFI